MTGAATLTGNLRGVLVEITSRGGIDYRGVVGDIVYVTDRAKQIRLASA